MELSNRTVVVTGAARGQGKEEARLLVEAGAHVVMADVLDDEGREAAIELDKSGERCEFVHLDVSSETDWRDLGQRLKDGSHPPVRGLINNAGVAARGSRVAEADIAEWQRVISINLYGPLLGIRTLAPLIRDAGGGGIVNTGSAAGITGHFAASYSASKWGLRGLTKTAAMELVSWRIRVNTVHPGIIRTPIIDGSDDFVAAVTGHTPQQRVAEAVEVARAVVWLVSDDASFITGTDLEVDGGLTALNPYWHIAQEVSGARPTPTW